MEKNRGRALIGLFFIPRPPTDNLCAIVPYPQFGESKPWRTVSERRVCPRHEQAADGGVGDRRMQRRIIGIEIVHRGIAYPSV